MKYKIDPHNKGTEWCNIVLRGRRESFETCFGFLIDIGEVFFYSLLSRRAAASLLFSAGKKFTGEFAVVW